jgi:hypothetical protein
MATYILLNPNEIVHQQQAMTAVNNNPISIPNKSSSSNDVSLNLHVYLGNLHVIVHSRALLNPSSFLFMWI